MKVHFIAIGGSAMHNLAIALHKKGYRVSGSDDEIFEPSRGRLAKYGLLPGKTGWSSSNITVDLDAVILGMHAKGDNPELAKAREKGLKIYSYPEFLYEQSRDKNRIVVGGSHGKTTITSIILHVFNYHSVDTDFMVGAQLEGFEVMVKLSENAQYMVLEGDEYLSSALDKRPKFHLYKPHIALLSGIAWDHINVFPTFDNYLEQFRIFINLIEKNGTLIYCNDDKTLVDICIGSTRKDLRMIPYSLPDHTIEKGKTYIHHNGRKWPVTIFGKHNLLNLAGAMHVCKSAGVTEEMFLEAVQSFKGASNRLELLAESSDTVVYKDFAHAPSKLKATTQAVKEQYPERKLIACMELHTYSSLNKDFLIQYKNAMENADQAIVFYNPHALKIKRLPDIAPEDIRDAFGGANLAVINDVEVLKNTIMENKQPDSSFLFMSSGNFGNLDLKAIAATLTNNKS